MRITKFDVATAVVVVICLAASLTNLSSPFQFALQQADYDAYYTAASFIRDHDAKDIYDNADTGIDPQVRRADLNSKFSNQAISSGIRDVTLYLYPPPLAYLMVPLSYVKIGIAYVIWKSMNWLFVFISAFYLVRIMRLPEWSMTTLYASLFIFAFRATLDCFLAGQVTLFLTCGEVVAVYWYLRGHKVKSCFLFAAAAAIKLTPGIVVLPLLLWRDWKALRAFVLWSALFIFLMWIPDRGWLLDHYFNRVMPAMSSGYMMVNNRSLSVAIRFIWAAIQPNSTSHWPSFASTAPSVLVVLIAIYLMRKNRIGDSEETQAIVFFIVLLLSSCLSPVAWRYTYVFAVPAIILLFRRARRDDSLAFSRVLLLLFVLSISGYGLAMIANATRNPLITIWAMSSPMLGSLLGLRTIYELRESKNLVLESVAAK